MPKNTIAPSTIGHKLTSTPRSQYTKEGRPLMGVLMKYPG